MLTVDPYTIVMLPDTQVYSESYSDVFEDQTQWVADEINEQEGNIVFLTHVGDIVDDSTQAQWGNADTAMAILDEDVPSLAYGALAGNHDFDHIYTHGNFADFASYFGPSRYEDWETRGWDEYGDSDSPEIDGLNHFQVFTGGGQQYLSISLEYEPRQESINWAQQVIDGHPTLPIILSTHEYINFNAQDEPIHSTTSPRDGASRNYHNGEKLFADLVHPNPQIFMVLCGHVHDEGRIMSWNVADQPVYEMLADYQNWNPGNQPENYGYLRILEFDPDNDQIHVSTYSPSLDKNLTDSDNEFDLTMDFDDRFSFPPTARLYAPVDNDVQDQDHLTNSVKVDTPQWEFQIQLYGHSSEIDDETVTADVLSIVGPGGLMDPSTYTFDYDEDDDRITLTRNDNELFDFGTYEITLSETTKIEDTGEREMPETVFTIEVFSPTEQSPSLLVAKHATWRYLDDGSNQGDALGTVQTPGWGELDFDDDDWGWGAAQLGYGDNDEGTRVSYGGDSEHKYITTYFRHEFSVPNPTAIQALALKLLRDDGAVVYLNGHHITRSNMPTGTFNYLTLASVQIGEPEEETYYEPTLDSGYLDHLVTGVNVIAVEVHQGAANSSDLSLDLQLEATYTIPTLYDESTGILYVFGSSGANDIALAASGGYVTIDTGGDPVTILPNVAAANVKGIRVYGYGGDDTIDLSGVTSGAFSNPDFPASGAIRIEGGAGNDAMIGSADFGETYVLIGSGLGTDSINAAAGVSYLEDDDTILVAPDSVATIAGNLSLADGACYQVQVDDTGCGVVAATGNVSLVADNTLVVQRPRSVDINSWDDETQTIVTAGGELNDTFTNVPNHLGTGVFCTAVVYDYDAETVDVDILQALGGDTDGDYDVDFADFNTLANNYTGEGGSGKDWTQGDFDADGDVDFTDFNTLANNYTGSAGYGGKSLLGGGGGERGLIAEMLARKYTPPAWLRDRWFAQIDQSDPDWLYEFELESGPADRVNASKELVDHLMELLLADAA